MRTKILIFVVGLLISTNFVLAQEVPVPDEDKYKAKPVVLTDKQKANEAKFGSCKTSASTDSAGLQACLEKICETEEEPIACLADAATYANDQTNPIEVRQAQLDLAKADAELKACQDIERTGTCKDSEDMRTCLAGVCLSEQATVGKEGEKDEPDTGAYYELEKAKKEANTETYSQVSNTLATEAKRSESKAAFAALNDQTGYFDVKNLSVGNESLLELGGAENNQNNILARVINVLARLFGTFAVLMFVIGAFFMITSQGDENQLQKGKTIFLYTVIGLLLGFTSYIIVQFVISILFQT